MSGSQRSQRGSFLDDDPAPFGPEIQQGGVPLSNADMSDFRMMGDAAPTRIARPVLAGNMTIHNLGERIADALVSGTDKEGKSNWETVVGRIRADRK